MNDNNISHQKFTVVVSCSKSAHSSYWLFLIYDLKKFHLMILKSIVMILMKCWKFGKAFISEVEKHAPLVNIALKGNNPPYITTDIRRMIRQRDYLRGKANKTGSEIFRQAFQQIRNKVSHAIRKTMSEYFSQRNWRKLRGIWRRHGKLWNRMSTGR